MRTPQRQQRPSMLQMLENARDDFDQLIADVALGIRNPRHFDDLEERGAGIGPQIHAAFRTGSR